MRKLIIIVTLFELSNAYSQYIYPPNFSFEEDSNTFILSKWQSNPRSFLGNSFSIARNSKTKIFNSTDGYVNFEMNSKLYNDTISNAFLTQTFSFKERPPVLVYNSMFFPCVTEKNYRLQITMFKNNGGTRQNILVFDSLIDENNNYDKIEDWAKFDMDLTKSYLSNDLPDSCTITFTCDIKDSPDFNGSQNMIQTLILDNIKFRTFDLGIAETKTVPISQLIVYPNLSHHIFNIKFNCESELPFTLSVFDIKGSQIQTEQGISKSSTYIKPIDLSAYAKGTYFITLIVKDKKYTEKIILD